MKSNLHPAMVGELAKPLTYTEAETAALCGIKKSTFQQRAREGRLPPDIQAAMLNFENPRVYIRSKIDALLGGPHTQK
ncbi:hypothetical protein [Corynebacterium rouxii]|uniref:Uncharacterized protein n=1 Tax=Corynebacterium rouxii TaxID=2719119 RepID=A0A6I8MC64_9CORY|nr:hypothetical protein [Corynebacterium rouxii]VZH85337.1 hypothetical protein FRC0190_01303 [Corynebacterium rouxii]